MKTVIVAFVLALGFVPGLAKADHCVDKVKSASHPLDKKAEHLAQALRNLAAPADVQDTADDVARDAKHLHQMAHSAASCHHLQHDFEKVQHSWEHFEDHLHTAHSVHHNPHIKAHVQEVRTAIAAVAAAFRTLPPPTPVHPVTVNVALGSGGYGQNQTVLPGTIQNALVVQQQSIRRCVAGRTFGWQGNTLWVNHGCRAVFSVTYLAQ